MGKWQHVFSKVFDGIVWNFHVMKDSGDLLLEIRNKENESVELARYCRGKIKKLPIIGMNWFSQVVYANDDFILCQDFDDNLNPDQTSVIAYETESGAVCWQKSNIRFDRAEQDGLMFINQDNERLLIDPKTGKEGMIPDFHTGTESLSLPVLYPQGSEFFPEMAGYIQKMSGKSAERMIDYFEIEGLIILSFYYSEDKRLCQDLLVIDEFGELIASETLGQDLKGIADPAFMFYNGNLIFVKENRHFFVYAIENGPRT